MILYIEGHDFHYETENLCRLFFPYERILVVREETASNEEAYASCVISQNGEELFYYVSIILDGKKRFLSDSSQHKEISEQERDLCSLLFKLLSGVTGKRPEWGILTGIHPVKRFRVLCDEIGVEKARDYFKNIYLVSDKKTGIAEDTMKQQLSIIKKNDAKSFSLYISIPFCPTRCSYCSFVSQSVERSKKLIPEYVEKLCEEIKHTGKVAKETGLLLRSAYIGGGTPTILSAIELDKIMKTARASFDFSLCDEFTVEAGRPDTITAEKLCVIKDNGADRISINPQSMNDDVLAAIGRKHSANDVITAFKMARELGFDNINMDVIIGLPGDTPESFNDTVNTLYRLSPENITVHALSLKHASRMTYEKEIESHKSAQADEMQMCSEEILRSNGYVPYYLYRQSRMAGNLENIGWCKPGKQCEYNIYTMEEVQTIIACGAGGVTKIKDPYTDTLERIFNFKYSYEYISRFDEILVRKNKIPELYRLYTENSKFENARLY